MSRTGRPITLPGPIGSLAKAMGSLANLCKALDDASPRTVRFWATRWKDTGELPAGERGDKMATLFKKYRIPTTKTDTD